MFDLCSDRLVESEDRFAGRNGHRFVEIWDCGDGRRPIFRSGELKEKEIPSWVDEERSANPNGPIQSGLRVLLSPKPSGKPSSGKLPFSRSTYQSLATSWRIPSTFMRALAQKLSIVTQCSVSPISSRPKNTSSSPTKLQPSYSPSLTTKTAPSSPTTKYSPTSPTESSPTSFAFLEQERDGNQERCSRISDQARCLLIRGDVDWTWDYTLISTHDPTTHTTYILIVGLTAVEIDLVQSYLSSLSLALTSPATTSSTLSTHPLLLPLILLDLATDDTASLLKLRIKLLGQIQQRTGMDRFNSLKSATVEGRKSIGGGKEKERQELDLDAVMLRLTCLSDWVAAQRGFVSLQQRVVGVVEGMLDDEIMKIEERDGGGSVGMVGRMFQERLDFVKESLIAAEQKCMYLERSIGAQVQTIYSLIGQKDNRLNISAASASCQIASDSRRITILTRRDSTDMRIIAAVTLIFLPGTFVATVFSTGMFDWGSGDPTPSPESDSPSPPGGGKLVSGYIWVYFMLTGILTFVVLVAWVLFSWFQNRKMIRQFGIDPEDGVGLDGTEGKRRNTETTLEEGRQRRQDSWVLREFEKWKDEARGSMRWWGKGKKDGREGCRTEELKSA